MGLYLSKLRRRYLVAASVLTSSSMGLYYSTMF